MSNLNPKSNTLNQPVISSFVGQKTSTHISLVLINKENAQQKDTCSSVKRSNEEHSPVEGNVTKKTNTKATPLKTLQLKLNKEDYHMDLLHEIQLLRNDMNKSHSELGAKVDSNTAELKTVQSSLSNLTGLLARVEKLEGTIAHLLSKNTQVEAENMLLKQKMTSLERRQLQNNIILSGLPEEPWEDLNS